MTAEDAQAKAGEKTFALALGGGGARGLAHIHVIEALDELGIRPTAISGSSIGALMGAGMAAGMRGSEIRDFVMRILGNRSEVMARIWKTRPASLSEFMEEGLRLTQFSVERILQSFLPDDLPATFEELSIPLMVTATDYYGHSLAVLDSGELRNALAASAAIPAVFSPVRRDGRLYVDGGVIDPVPFDLLESRADAVIAVDVVGAPSGPAAGSRKPGSIDLVLGSSQIMMQTITELKLQKHKPAIMLRPPVSNFRALDFLKVDTVLRQTSGLRDQVKRAVGDVLEGRSPQD